MPILSLREEVSLEGSQGNSGETECRAVSAPRIAYRANHRIGPGFSSQIQLKNMLKKATRSG